MDSFIDVDVGTPTRLRVTLDNAVAFRLMYHSPYSRLFQLKRRDGGTEVLVVRWMDPISAGSDKDDVAISAVPNKSIVPEYEGKQRFMHQGTYVSIGVRRYIEGKPLSEVMKRATEEQMDHYKLQVSSLVTELSMVTSDQYGSILDGKLKTSTVSAYMAAHNMIEKLRDRNYTASERISTSNDWDVNCKPRLCHGSLWPEHIIVNGTSVEGFVGWSNSDFVPEPIDRYMYFLWHVKLGREQQWRQFLSTIICTESVAKNHLAQRDMLDHAQSVAAIRAGKRGHKRVTDRARLMMREILESDYMNDGVRARDSKVSLSETVSDKKSLSALTDETIDTWENFTVATETTAR